MQEERRPRAHAVVRVTPDHAACYWQAVCSTLGRLGAAGAHLDISVVEPSLSPPQGAAEFVELEIRSAELEQSTLDAAIRQTPVACGVNGHGPDSSPASRVTPQTDPDATIRSPLAARLQATVEAPLLPHAAVQHPPAPAAAVIVPQAQMGHEQPLPAQPLEAAPETTPRPTVRVALGARVVEGVKVGAILLAILISVRSLVQTFSVSGPSMLPTFETAQRLLVNKAAYWHVEGTPLEGLTPYTKQGSVAYLFGGPRRGDVAVFRPPGESNFESDLIKRVIGLPGDTVSIQAGNVYVNGEQLIEPYVQLSADYTYPGPELAVLVPNDSYFVLGDNRPVSADSHLGWMVPADKLVGQAWLSYWPPPRWGVVARVEPHPMPG